MRKKIPIMYVSAHANHNIKKNQPNLKKEIKPIALYTGILVSWNCRYFWFLMSFLITIKVVCLLMKHYCIMHLSAYTAQFIRGYYVQSLCELFEVNSAKRNAAVYSIIINVVYVWVNFVAVHCVKPALLNHVTVQDCIIYCAQKS